MARMNNMIKVEIINREALRDALRIYGEKAGCCYDTDPKHAEKVARACIKSGHFAPSRGISIEFKFSVVPRYTADQIVRHNVGGSPAMQSFRYVTMDNAEYFVPELVIELGLGAIYCDFAEEIYAMYDRMIQLLKEKGVTGEKANECARGLLPLGTNTVLHQGFTFEAIINFCKKRLCNRAESPARLVAEAMRELVLEIFPELAPYLTAPCVNKSSEWCPKTCPEGKMCCGKAPTYLSENGIVCTNLSEVL